MAESFFTRCSNSEFRLCCLFLPLRLSLSLLFPTVHSVPPPPLLPPPPPYLPLSRFSLFSFYCFCLSASLCVRESLIGASGLLHVKSIFIEVTICPSFGAKYIRIS